MSQPNEDLVLKILAGSGHPKKEGEIYPQSAIAFQIEKAFNDEQKRQFDEAKVHISKRLDDHDQRKLSIELVEAYQKWNYYYPKYQNSDFTGEVTKEFVAVELVKASYIYHLSLTKIKSPPPPFLPDWAKWVIGTILTLAGVVIAYFSLIQDECPDMSGIALELRYDSLSVQKKDTLVEGEFTFRDLSGNQTTDSIKLPSGINYGKGACEILNKKAQAEISCTCALNGSELILELKSPFQLKSRDTQSIKVKYKIPGTFTQREKKSVFVPKPIDHTGTYTFDLGEGYVRESFFAVIKFNEKDSLKFYPEKAFREWEKLTFEFNERDMNEGKFELDLVVVCK